MAYLIPNWRSEPVADHDVDLVKLFVGSFWSRQNVPTNLTDVLSAVAVVTSTVLPEMTNRKLLSAK